MISRDRLIAASLTSLMCQCTIKPFQCWYCVLALSADLFYFPFDFLLSSIFVFLLTIRSLSLEFVIISSLVYHCFFCFLFYFFRLILTRKLWHSYNTLCVTLLHGAFSRCYVATFRVKSLWLKLVSSSAAAEHTSQAFLDVTFKQRVRNWIDSGV